VVWCKGRTIGWVGEIVNVDQAREWSGPEGEHWVANQARYEDLDRAFTPVLMDAAAIGPRDRVLDIGCGCGQTTLLAAARATDGSALGVDLSAPMLERAAADAAAARVGNVRFERADAQVHRFTPGEFDVALSRFGVMFFADPVAAFANIGDALEPGGRLVFLCWQDVAANEWVTVPATAALAHVPFPELGSGDEPGPFSLADPARITDVLSRAGFDDIEVRAAEGPLRLGDDADDALEFLAGIGVARTLLDQVDDATAERALEAVRHALRPHERPEGLSLSGAAWLVTAHEG
jgi:SAM-dependent methyltransferase